MPLPEERRTQLDGIINQMIQNKEPEENIQWVVNDFKSKYGGNVVPPPSDQQTMANVPALSPSQELAPPDVNSEEFNKLSTLTPQEEKTASAGRRSVFPMVGLMAGSLAGGIPGAGGGYALGKQVANVADISKGNLENVPSTPTDVAKQYGKDVGIGAATEAGGVLLGKGIKAGIGLFKSSPEAVDKAIESGIEKGIRPSVSGKGTEALRSKYMGRAKDAVKAIIDNKPTLALTDETGNVVTGELPKNLKQFSEAIDQVKRQIFAKYDAMASQTLEKGIPKITDKGIPIANKMEVSSWTPAVEPNIGGIPVKTGKYGQVVQTPKEFPPTVTEPYRGKVYEPMGISPSQSGMVETQFPYSHAIIKDPATQKYLVNLNPISKELKAISGNKVLNDLSPDIVNYAKTRATAFSTRGTYTTSEAQDAIGHLNQSLEAFYKNPTYENASKASVDAMIANRLRGALDDTIEQAVGPGYQELKNTYGALSAIEKDVVRRSIVDSRKNIKGLIDFSDIYSGGEAVSGILSMNPFRVGKALAMKTISALYKHVNSPNVIVSNMFGNVEKLMTPTVPTSGEIPKLIGRGGAYGANIGLMPQMTQQ